MSNARDISLLNTNDLPRWHEYNDLAMRKHPDWWVGKTRHGMGLSNAVPPVYAHPCPSWSSCLPEYPDPGVGDAGTRPRNGQTPMWLV